MRYDVKSMDRVLVDLLYFLVVLVILLNIVFCFICGIEKVQFDRQAEGGFKHHTTHDHNMWNYMNFIIFIDLQDKDDDDGLELYVRNLIASEDLSWLPMNKAICLNATTNTTESIEDKVENSQKSLEDRLSYVEEKILKVLHESNQAIAKSTDSIMKKLMTKGGGASSIGTGNDEVADQSEFPEDDIKPSQEPRPERNSIDSATTGTFSSQFVAIEAAKPTAQAHAKGGLPSHAEPIATTMIKIHF